MKKPIILPFVLVYAAYSFIFGLIGVASMIAWLLLSGPLFFIILSLGFTVVAAFFFVMSIAILKGKIPRLAKTSLSPRQCIATKLMLGAALIFDVFLLTVLILVCCA